MPVHAPTLTYGALALVTFGPSAGTVVRLEKMAYAPPGCDGCAVHTLQPPGPVWLVSKFLLWDVVGPRGVRRYRIKAAPVTALRPIPSYYGQPVH
jgi:hypothetical protein